MSESCPAPSELAALAEGRLDDAIADPLRRHIDVCDDCGMAVALLAQTHPSCPSDDAPEPEAGATVADRYRLEAKVGSGAMAVVWAATDLRLERRVALKLVHSGADAEAMARRLVRESKAMARLRHPNVITVHDAGSLADGVYIAMELVDGVNLRRWLRAGARRRSEVVDVLRDAGRGLAAAHDAGLVHRDFKPDNVLVDHGGVGLVGDFGLVHVDGDEPIEEGGATEELPIVELERLTSTGVVVGTPAYMAPEQFEGVNVGVAADIFAFCVTVWEALAGRRPFGGRTLDALRSNVSLGRIEDPRAVPRGLRSVLRAGLSVDPTRRPSDVRTIVAALDRHKSRRARWAGLTAGVAALSVGVGVLVADAAPACPPVPTRWSTLRPEASRALTEGLSAGRAEAIVSYGDAYADEIATAWGEACRTDTQDERRDAMMSCVRGRGRSLDSVAALAATDPEHAERAARRLPRVQRCLSTGVAVDRPLPGDPELRKAVAELWAEHDALLLRIESGPSLAAIEETDDFLRRAEAVGYAPLVATAKWLRGVAMMRRSHPGAKDALIDAAWAASGAGFDFVAARAWTQLVSMCHDPLRDFERGHEYAGNAQALLDRIRDDTDVRFLQAHLLKEHGLVYQAEGRLEEARESLEAAVEMAEGCDVDLRDDSREGLAMLAASQGNLEEARELYRLVLEARRERYPADHPHVAFAHLNLGANHFESGEYEAALEQMIAARDGFAAAYGDDHVEVFNARFNVGQCLDALGRRDEADVELAAAQVELERAGNLPLRLAWVLEARAGIVAERDEAEGLRLIDAATEIYKTELGRDDPELARHYVTKAEVLLQAGRDAAALEAAQQAVTLVKGMPDLHRIFMPAAQLLLGRSLVANGRYADAIEPLELALAGYDEQEVTRGLEFFTRGFLAQALWETGQRERASTVAREAVAGMTEHGLEAERETFTTWAAAAGLPLP